MRYFGTIYADATTMKCRSSIKTIATDMKLSSAMVKRALENLEHFGYLKKLPYIVQMGVTSPLVCCPISKNKAQLYLGGELRSFAEPRGDL